MNHQIHSTHTQKDQGKMLLIWNDQIGDQVQNSAMNSSMPRKCSSSLIVCIDSIESIFTIVNRMIFRSQIQGKHIDFACFYVDVFTMYTLLEERTI